jgi:hypothetical protein
MLTLTSSTTEALELACIFNLWRCWQHTRTVCYFMAVAGEDRK